MELPNYQLSPEATSGCVIAVIFTFWFDWTPGLF